MGWWEAIEKNWENVKCQEILKWKISDNLELSLHDFVINVITGFAQA